MSLSIRPVVLRDREELASLVEANLSHLEAGLSLLDRRLPAGEVAVDLVAVDARGRLVLCMLGSGSDSALLVQALEAYGWCHEQMALIGRLFPSVKIDATAPPRLFLLAPRFSDSLRRAARHLGSLPLSLVECRCQEVNGARGICFEPVEGDAEAAGPPEPIPPEAAEAPGDPARQRVRQLVSHLERLSFRQAFR